MFTEVLLAAAFQVLPFYEQKPSSDFYALRPFWSRESETTDVLWPVFTRHRDWWRFCFFTHYQDYPEGGYQFEVMPLWWNGRTKCECQPDSRAYAGLFPIAGCHPHVLLVHDFKFCLWPLWMQYKMPRPKEKSWLTTNAVLWPFVHWRDDGSWGVWPFYVCNAQRESYHQTALWPLVTWADYEADRDTAGAGSSWMVWPLFGSVSRERESQTLVLPPLFSYAETPDGSRLRCPWPLVEFERTTRRDRLSVFPLYEKSVQKSYGSKPPETTYRFGWKLVELYPDETRVFPFWVSRSDDSYFRLWPFYERARGKDGVSHGRFLSLFPIRWVPAVDRNWSKFWTFYEREERADKTDHSLLWGLIRWSSEND